MIDVTNNVTFCSSSLTTGHHEQKLNVPVFLLLCFLCATSLWHFAGRELCHMSLVTYGVLFLHGGFGGGNCFP